MVSSQFNSLSALGIYYFKFSYSGGWVSSFLICKVPDQLIVAHFFFVALGVRVGGSLLPYLIEDIGEFLFHILETSCS